MSQLRWEKKETKQPSGISSKKAMWGEILQHLKGWKIQTYHPSSGKAILTEAIGSADTDFG